MTGPAPPIVLIVEDDEDMRSLLEDEVGEHGYAVRTAGSGADALALLEASPPDVVVTDLVMPGVRGDELLARIRDRDPDLPVVIMTAFGTIESAVEAMKAGAYHYVAKPFRMEQLLLTIANALRERGLRRQLSDLRAGHEGDLRIVAESPAMRRAVDLTLRAASADSPVLLLGESGTGKELIARALHEASPRKGGRFLAINCSAIPETLLESQLFGHRRGAFTDAREDRRGLFQEAAGGTILLDEIGDMPLPLQAKMLRVLQEREVHPLGASAPVAVDVRVVAATHRDLETLQQQGTFRQDLYYRLNVIAIRVPPLRERPDDLVPLIAHFLNKHGRRLSRAGCTLSSQAFDLVRRYSWPGNVRELENVIERALVLAPERVIRPSDLPDSVRSRAADKPGLHALPPLQEMEQAHIERALRSVGGNKAAAARMLGLDRKTLYRKLRRFAAGES